MCVREREFCVCVTELSVSCVCVRVLCVSKLCVRELCVRMLSASKLCVRELCVSARRRREAGGRRSGWERTTKNKNPTQRCGEKNVFG